MNVVTIVGARPQFIKAAPVSRVLAEAGHREILVHTGQHYDPELSDRFLSELGLNPDIELGVGSEPGRVGEMCRRLVSVLGDHRPDRVLVYGDTDSTRAGAVAASEAGRVLAHVEAGLRCGDLSMPEERNRLVADHCAQLLFCPDDGSAANLVRERASGDVLVVGDVMVDALDSLSEGGAAPVSPYVLATIHRAENTDDAGRLAQIAEALGSLGERVIAPLHPRTRAALDATGVSLGPVEIVEPLGYRDMIAHIRNARVVVTDSGGLQKEAAWLGVACVTIRDVTEWPATVHAGWNVLVPADAGAIRAAVRGISRPDVSGLRFAAGASRRVVQELERVKGVL